MSLGIGCLLLSSMPTQAQIIIADPSVGTQIAENGSFIITGGTIQGANLFHSFSTFSPDTAATVFDLDSPTYGGTADTVNTIISRVTGKAPSTINGLLQIQGGAAPDLFLLNPNGIIFGPDVRLNLPGSFIASTADSILFDNGVEFVADELAPTLLTMTAPIGLQLGNNPGAIQVQGDGHSLMPIDPVNSINSPLLPTAPLTGLQVVSGKTLALVGGQVALMEGVLTAASGRIEIGGANTGQVSLTPHPSGWELGYENVQNFRDIQLLNQSLLDVSSALDFSGVIPIPLASGSIQLQGEDITLADGSLLLNYNLGLQSSGSINITAFDSIAMYGLNISTNVQSGINSTTLGPGAGANIQVTAQQLSVDQGANLAARSIASGAGGNISITVPESVFLGGASLINPLMTGGINSSTLGAGNAGNTTVSTGQLTAINGGTIASVTLASGNSGQVLVNADSITLIGVAPFTFVPSSLSASTTHSVDDGLGKAGSVNINTRQLRVIDGARVGSGTVSHGDGGSLMVNASEFVEVSGVGASSVPGATIPSFLEASATTVDPVLAALFGLPLVPFGESGDLVINTPILNVTDGGVVAVRNEGTGNGGTLQVNAEQILLNNQAEISASTVSGEGGNLVLTAQDVLLMRQGSLISAEAGGSGSGGNVTIDSPILVGLENSDIVANAIEGDGGNISITTKGILGLERRQERTAGNDITASSEFGVSGTVAISNIDAVPGASLVELPTELSDPSNQITAACSATDNSLVSSGRGGVPINPGETLLGSSIWHDLRDISELRQTAEEPVTQTKLTPIDAQPSFQEPQLTEATAWTTDANGQITFFAAEKAAAHSATCLRNYPV